MSLSFADLLARPSVARLLSVLDGDGEEARIVGGAVRNTLMDLPVADVDLATTAEPPVVVSRARKAGLTVIPTGIAHGTVTVVVDGAPFEVTTLRRDVDTDGRHAVVAFGRDFDADAQRRDFTMNALSLERDGTLHDPVGGLSDVLARRVRFIGDPRTRIREDYLRILRLFRFHAAYGIGALDTRARDATIAERDGLARLSAERVNAELSKLLGASRAAEVLGEFAETGLLGRLLGGVCYTSRFARAVATETALGRRAEPVARLAALALATREDAARLRERLRLSNAAERRFGQIAAGLERNGTSVPTVADVDEMLYRSAGRDAVRDTLILLHASRRASVDDVRWRGLHEHAALAPIPHLPASGNDFLQRGLAPGPTVGAALKALQAQWIRAGFPRDPATIARLIDGVLRAGP